MPSTDTPVLSVVTITYRDPLGLAATLKSLEGFHDSRIRWENIVVDASPGENRELLQRLDPVWPLIHSQQAARGIYPALNAGFRQSRGNLIWFLNGGDRLKDLPALLQIIDRFKADPSLDLIGAGAALYREGRYLYPLFPKGTFLGNILGSNHLCHQGIIYRRESFLKIGEFDERFKIAADYQHLIRCYLANLNALFMRKLLVDYDMGGASARVHEALADIANVHREMARLYPFPLGLLDRTMALIEEGRVRAVKALGNSPMGPSLRRGWVFLHRARRKG